MDPVIIIIAAAVGIAVGFGAARLFGSSHSPEALQTAENEAQKLLESSRAEAAELKKAAEVEGKEQAFQVKSAAETEIRSKQKEISRRDEELAKRKRELESKRKEAERDRASFDKREHKLAGREKAADKAIEKAEASQADALRTLEQVSGLTAEEAREQLENSVVSEARAKAADEVKRIDDEATSAAQAKAKEIIATAIQRYASEFVAERTVASVPLPSDDLKGRLIGREGRNIRALEAAAGIDMIIDDTAEMITISCFNPVRREIARLAVGKLVQDGRIHPTRIEEVVRESEKLVKRQCKEAGEQAVFDLGIHKMHPELVNTLGKLKYRSSYAQNLLQHSVEVGFLAGLMAAEVGTSVKLARRAGLLHDIGKAIDHELEGSHAIIGADMARKFGESPKVSQAIACHHEDREPTSLLDHIVDAANRLSSARPGARRELLASYVKRLEDLEAICTEHQGVTRAYALQAGREVRVIVENDKVSDAQAHMLSKQIARDIEERTSYAGQIRVVVVRETRASDYAR